MSTGVWLADVTRIDSAEQTFAANLVIVMSWKDPALVHRESSPMRYSLRDIWHPTWLIANATTNVQSTLPEIANVAADGQVTYRQRLIGTFSQRLDLRAFPFDRATFHIHFVMVGQSASDLEFTASGHLVAKGVPNAAGVAERLTLQDWHITGIRAGSLPYEVAPGLEVPGYVVEFQADRLVQHYVAKVIIPLLLIVIMSWAAFWLDPTLGGSQISIAVTSMLTLIAYRSAIGAETPRLPYLTNLDAFILTSSILVLLTLIEVIATSTLVMLKREPLARRIDLWSRAGFPVAYAAVTAATFLR